MDAVMTIDALDFTLIPAEDEALRKPVRHFLEETVMALPAERRARSWMGFDAGFSRALAQRGWLGLTLPREYGGGSAALSPASSFPKNCSLRVRQCPRIGLPTAKAVR